MYHSLDNEPARRFSGGKTKQQKDINRPVKIWRWPENLDSIDWDGETTEGSQLPFLDKPFIAVLPFDDMSGEPVPR